ncbi:hypothetical protein KR52_10040 [Synechococcus sp. KORDI-52]|nr:hypothetical protein KR52_10040 [Synechococcus sp. KORDI-52]
MAKLLLVRDGAEPSIHGPDDIAYLISVDPLGDNSRIDI